jgi:hypothetical protein
MKKLIRKILLEYIDKQVLLTEGRYSTTVNIITKDIMREIINFLKSDEDILEWQDNYYQESFSEDDDYYDDDDEDDDYDENGIETFMVFLNVEKVDTDYPFDINAYKEWNEDESSETIVTNIEINPNLFRGRIINNFQAELKDMFRHEIEHLYQEVNPNKRVEYIVTNDFVEEVLQPAEIDAYLQGFYTQAKTRKVTMNQIIDEWIEQRKRHFKNQKEMDKVRSEFINHGKKLLPKAKWV